MCRDENTADTASTLDKIQRQNDWKEIRFWNYHSTDGAVLKSFEMKINLQLFAKFLEF